MEEILHVQRASFSASRRDFKLAVEFAVVKPRILCLDSPPPIASQAEELRIWITSAPSETECSAHRYRCYFESYCTLAHRVLQRLLSLVHLGIVMA